MIKKQTQIPDLATVASDPTGPLRDDMRRAAFTLAEILITLAIIGIVAALTIPNITYSYKKKVTETRLLKFYTTMNQAIKLSELENGDKKTWDFTTGANDTIENKQKFFDKYYAKYIKILKTEPIDDTLAIYFTDGSAAQMSYASKDYTYCINAKDIVHDALVYGSKCFFFGFYPNTTEQPYTIQNYYGKGIEPYVPNYVRDETGAHLRDENGKPVKFTEADLYTERLAAAKIIQNNGWKIPDDYPWKL